MAKDAVEMWLANARNCLDENVEYEKDAFAHRLTAEFGIYDNWPILLRADFATVAKDMLTGNLQYQYVPIRSVPDLMEGDVLKTDYDLEMECNKALQAVANEQPVTFDYMPGTVIAALRILNPAQLLPQYQEYTVSMMLHPYQVIEAPGKWIHHIRDVNEDICKYAMQQNVAFCLPKSKGYLGEPSRNVAWSPK